MTQKREFYRGDCLEILENYIERESVDLIYLDPPFNSNSTYTLPFKKKDKNLKPVEAFTDFWEWTIDDEVCLAEWKRKSREPQHSIATIIEFAYRAERNFGRARGRKYNLAAYLLNMAQRLLAIRYVLKETGSIYLHCDPTCGHYLKLILDAIFGKGKFRNEIVWFYPSMSAARKQFPKKHDTIFFYTKSNSWTFNGDHVREPYDEQTVKRYEHDVVFPGGYQAEMNPQGRLPFSVWQIPLLRNVSPERLGYPTQKPLALLDRIIKASSNPGDIVLDPFCGCGTAVEAAETLGRQWIGIDISRFSVGLMQERVVSRCRISPDTIKVIGLPETIPEAIALAKSEPFEFEKWVASSIGANGMYKELGRPGPDSGVDGVMEIKTIHEGKVQDETVIIQVKGGNVTPDSVKALSETVRRRGSIAGIMVCFENQMGTVNNQRSREMWHDDSGTYPVIQGFTIEDLLAGERPLLPPKYGITRGGRITA